MQLDEIRSVLGDDVTAHLVGIQRINIERQKIYPGSVRAIQYLHALVCRQGQTVSLADIVTSFRYSAWDRQTPQETPACGPEIVVTGDGDGI